MPNFGVGTRTCILGDVRGGSAMIPFDRAMASSYKLFSHNTYVADDRQTTDGHNIVP